MSIFKKIIDRELPAEIVYEDEFCLAFKDIQPKAPVHLLLIPKIEIRSLAEANENHKELLGHLLLKASEIAHQQGLDSGFQVITNSGESVGQTVFHLHFHILGGKKLSWP
ncbi:MAG: histidine triad nucleotide-binding protein [Bdellovibrionaceae bacterium]|nr:histidine triad nucleotide-binding protein [Pseudobdellovibrionaceae bacterium]|tara:strand:- start:1606 stop:1935 length:330 start_codon:yes stop_codon:yes gene_type:complete